MLRKALSRWLSVALPDTTNDADSLLLTPIGAAPPTQTTSWRDLARVAMAKSMADLLAFLRRCDWHSLGARDARPERRGIRTSQALRPMPNRLPPLSSNGIKPFAVVCTISSPCSAKPSAASLANLCRPPCLREPDEGFLRPDCPWHRNEAEAVGKNPASHTDGTSTTARQYLTLIDLPGAVGSSQSLLLSSWKC